MLLWPEAQENYVRPAPIKRIALLYCRSDCELMDKYDSKPGALYRAICVAIVVRIGELTSFIYNLEQRSRSGSPANGEDKVVKRTAAGRRCGGGRRRFGGAKPNDHGKPLPQFF